VSAAETPQGLPPLWVAVGVLLVVGALTVWAVLAATRRQQREMERLTEAMWEADREWRRAMIAYLTQPAVKPVAPTRKASTPSWAKDEAITVELEVIKVDEERGPRK